MRFHHTPLNSMAIAVAVWLAALTLRPMFADADFLTWVPAVVGISAALGAIGALVSLPRLATLAAQVLGMAGVLAWLGLRWAPVPAQVDHAWYRPLLLLAETGTASVRTNATPLPSDPGLVWLLLCVLAVVVLATEVLVNALEQPAWSLAPLGVVYAVGALTLPNEMEFSAFVVIAVGYALVLVTSVHLSGVTRRPPGAVLSRLLMAAVTLVVAVLVAPLVTSLVPLGPKQPWLQAGSSAPIELSDPKVALTENLKRPAEQEVLRYRTDSETPVYLRTVALTRLSTSGAELTGMQLSTTGLSEAYEFPGRDVDTSVRMTMPSEYLPVPFAVDNFRADGEWAHDKDTMTIVATGDARTEQTEGLEFKVSSTVPDPDRADLESANAGADPAGDLTLNVPDGLDPGVLTLTNDITAEADTDGEKALAIQRFLRSERFTYSLVAPDTAGMDTLSDFLLEDNSGYCIHFAAGMITMARLEGIPARMAIGFTPGTREGDDWVVTTHNMHSWPELYFEGLGWVPFEPTKSVAGPPSYTDPDTAPDPSPSPSTSPGQSEAPSPSPSVPTEPTDEPTVAPTPTDTPDDSNSAGWLLLLGVAVLLALPFAARWSTSMWRLRSGQEPAAAADAAWREVHSLFMDAGLEWDDSSPVLAAHALGRQVGPDVAAQLNGVAGTVERVRFARGGADTSELGAQVRHLRSDLLRALPGDRQARALLLPASLLPSGMRSG